MYEAIIASRQLSPARYFSGTCVSGTSLYPGTSRAAVDPRHSAVPSYDQEPHVPPIRTSPHANLSPSLRNLCGGPFLFTPLLPRNPRPRLATPLAFLFRSFIEADRLHAHHPCVATPGSPCRTLTYRHTVIPDATCTLICATTGTKRLLQALARTRAGPDTGPEYLPITSNDRCAI